MIRDRHRNLNNLHFGTSRRLTIMAAAVLSAIGLASPPGIAEEGGAAPDNTMVGQRQPMIFRVQPTPESVREGLALKGPPSPADLGLKNAIERSANELSHKMIICRGC
jgi:hypothetical protein